MTSRVEENSLNPHSSRGIVLPITDALVNQVFAEENQRMIDYLQAIWKRQALEARGFEQQRQASQDKHEDADIDFAAYRWCESFRSEVLTWRGVYENLMEMPPRQPRRGHPRKHKPQDPAYERQFMRWFNGDRTFAVYFKALEHWDSWFEQVMKTRGLDLPHLLSIFAMEFEDQVMVEDPLPRPRKIPPPRHARVMKGRLVRLVGEDIQDQIGEGERLLRSLECSEMRPVELYQWRERTAAILKQFQSPMTENFLILTKWMLICEVPMPSPARLSRGYMLLGLAYLEEVINRMPDYEEIAGQTVRPIGISISGSTFYGSQVATTITNIQSTITGLAQSGETEIAAALAALERAVRDQEDIDDTQRQDLLDNVTDLAAESAPAGRRSGRIRSAISYLREAAGAGTELAKAIQATEPVLRQLLP
jgi:hypothetical protein